MKGHLRMKSTIRFAVFAIAGALVFAGGEFSGGNGLISQAQAQDAGAEKSRTNSGRQTKRTEAHSEKGIKILTQAQEQMEADNNGGAVSTLTGMLGNPGSYKGIDIAIGHKFRAYAYIGQDKYGSALADFDKAIAHPSLPDWDKSELQFNIAQIALAQGQVSKAIRALEAWFAQAENPNAAAYFFAAQAYAQGDRWADAERNVEQGLAKMDKANPQENWYRVASVIYLQREKFSKARPLLETMISLWPGKKEYYAQLGAVYSELGREKDSFAMLAMAYDNKLDLNGSEVLRLGQLYRMYEYPYRAAKIIEKGINDGKLKRNKKNCEEMGNAYFQAREMKRAMNPLECAAKASNDGEIWLRLCQVHVQEDAWKSASAACNSAISKGGLDKDGGMAWQLAGIARYELGEREEAIEAFDKCMGWDNTADSCVKWKNSVQAELVREKAERDRQEAAAKAEAERQKEIEDQIKQIEKDSQSLSSSTADEAAGAQ